MLNKKLKVLEESKLAKTLTKITEEVSHEKTGFVLETTKSSLFKTKSFRLREADLLNLKNIISYVNNNDRRMSYSDSQIIRGLINYFSDNAEANIKKVLPYIRSSS